MLSAFAPDRKRRLAPRRLPPWRVSPEILDAGGLQLRSLFALERSVPDALSFLAFQSFLSFHDLCSRR